MKGVRDLAQTNKLKIHFMKNKKILAAALVMMIAFVAVVGLTQTSFAAGMNKKGKTASSASEIRTNKKASSTSAIKNLRNILNKTANQAGRVKKQAAVEAAITANDYNAWVSAVGTSSPLLSKITSDNFSKLVQVHSLRQQADALAKELGIKQERGQGNGFGLGHTNQ